jgi:uncharacterized protein
MSFELLVSGAFGALTGVVAGYLGIGGGAILAPLLILALGLDQHRAQGISLAALVPPVGLPALIAYRKIGVRVKPRLVALLVLGFVVGAPSGAWLAHRLGSRELRWLFVVFLLVSAWRAALVPETDDDTPSEPRVAFGAAIGFAAGVLSGLLGVGGGLIALPLLRSLVGLPRLEAQATTLAMLLPPLGLPAVFVYAQEEGGLPWGMLAAVGIGFAIGGFVGAHLAGRSSPAAARSLYAGFLVLMAIVLIARLIEG